jgi:hypothetical protein
MSRLGWRSHTRVSPVWSATSLGSQSPLRSLFDHWFDADRIEISAFPAGSTLLATLVETYPYARAVAGEKFDTCFLQRRYKSLARFSPAANSSLSSLKSFNCSNRYSRARSQFVLRPTKERPRRFDLAN